MSESLSQSSPPAVTEALDEFEKQCRNDAHLPPSARNLTAYARARVEQLFREQQEEIERLRYDLDEWKGARNAIADAWDNVKAELAETRASLSSLKDSQLTAEEAKTLLDYLERPTSFDRNLIPGTMAKLRSISSTPAPQEDENG